LTPLKPLTLLNPLNPLVDFLVPVYRIPVNHRILFICTGNYYRSRFAEAVFNHQANLDRLGWTAFSRGLAVHLADGPISTFTSQALGARSIDLNHTAPDRVQISEIDFERSKRQIALDLREHLPMMQAQFPHWADKIEYWNVADMPYDTPENALPEIERKVIQLIQELSQEEG
jgi:protein-tyrosine phosphatase